MFKCWGRGVLTDLEYRSIPLQALLWGDGISIARNDLKFNPKLETAYSGFRLRYCLEFRTYSESQDIQDDAPSYPKPEQPFPENHSLLAFKVGFSISFRPVFGIFSR